MEWDILFKTTKSQLDKERQLDEAQLLQIIEKLKLAIRDVGESGIQAGGQRGTFVDYFPYWTLGLAYERQGEFEKAYLRQLLADCDGNIAQAARVSGISRRTIYEKFDKLGVDKNEKGR